MTVHRMTFGGMGVMTSKTFARFPVLKGNLVNTLVDLVEIMKMLKFWILFNVRKSARPHETMKRFLKFLDIAGFGVG